MNTWISIYRKIRRNDKMRLEFTSMQYKCFEHIVLLQEKYDIPNHKTFKNAQRLADRIARAHNWLVDTKFPYLNNWR